jgi:RNA polymerase sigma factor (sigma-70 family)
MSRESASRCTGSPDETRVEMAMCLVEPTRYRGYPTAASETPEGSGRTTDRIPHLRQARPARRPGNVARHRRTGLSDANHRGRRSAGAEGRMTAAATAQALEAGPGTVDPGPLADEDTAHLLRLAGHGDEAALRAIVDRFDGMLWSVVRGFRLGDAQAADAVQATWLRLVENLGTIRTPERLPGWLRTTAQRASIDAIRTTRRETQLDLDGSDLGAPENRAADRHDNEPEASAVRKERVAMVRRAVQELPERHQELLGLLVASPPMSYEEIGARLSMPVGSIGPTRARLLARLRTALEAADIYGLAA